MRPPPLRMIWVALLFAISGSVLSSCVTSGYGYSGGYAVDFYEPRYGIYGDWGPGYQVGPYRDGGGQRGPSTGVHGFRSAPASRSMPSIPSVGRSHGDRGHR